MKLRPSLVLLSVAFLGVVSMTSCVKNYTCQCSIVYSGVPGLPDSSAQSYSISNTQSKAKSECEAQSATYNNRVNPEQGNISTVETCILY